MGLPLESSFASGGPQLAPQQLGAAGSNREWIDAPMRLQTESYEAFSQRFASLTGQAGAATEVEDELRRLDIDPALFYGNAQRLALRRFNPDEEDPLAAPKAKASALGIQLAPLGQQVAGEDEDEEREVGGSWAQATEKGARFGPPARRAAEGGGGEEKPLPSTAVPGLHVPRHALEEEYEEVLDLGIGETHGGRMGHETPCDLDTRLQVDNITDDGDEDDFREEVLAAPEPEPEEGDVIEAFSLDPEFDYDNVTNLTSRMP